MRHKNLWLLLILIVGGLLLAGRPYWWGRTGVVRFFSGEAAAAPVAGRVLGESTAPPQLLIYGSGGSQTGSLIALSSREEPAIELVSYDLSGDAVVEVFAADLDDLWRYYLHDKNGKPSFATVDYSQLRYVTSFTQRISSNTSTPARVNLPIGESGIWLLKVSLGGQVETALVVRSTVGMVAKEGKDRFVFWGQDFATKRSLTSGTVRLVNLQDQRRELGRAVISSRGTATLPYSAEADLAVLETGSSLAIVPINLTSFSYGYDWRPFPPKKRNLKYFLFTDRPVYQPGDTVYFKSVVRDDDDARYSVPKGQVRAQIIRDWNREEPIFEKTYSLSAAGSISGQYAIPQDAATGSYQLYVSEPNTTGEVRWGQETYVTFPVEHFRKPEYSLEIEAPTTELVLGDRVPISVQGAYFFGQPLAGRTIKYDIYGSDFYDYEYYADTQQGLSDQYRYGYWNNRKVSSGELVLDSRGQAIIDLDTKIIVGSLTTQVLSIEASIIDETQNPAFVRKNILIYPADFGIYQDQRSSLVPAGGTIEMPVVLVSRRSSSTANIELTAQVHRDYWVSSQESGMKYPSWRRESEDLPALRATTDTGGRAVFSFTAAQPGSYKVNVEGHDVRGYTVRKDFYTWVSATEGVSYDNPVDTHLTVQPDRPRYAPGDIGKLYITSTEANRDVFLTLQRGYVDRHLVVKLNGTSATVDLPILSTDITTTYAVVSSFGAGNLDRASAAVKVVASSKKLQVSVTPQQEKFGPGDTVNLNVETKDQAGNPVSAEVAVWAVDKALFELVDERPGQIFDTFWAERYDDTSENNSLVGIAVNSGAEMGGCFAAGTTVTMADGSQKPIEQVRVGDSVLSRNTYSSAAVAGRVVGTHTAEADGYLILNLDLRVTPNHLLNMNGVWKEAGSVQIGDILVDPSGEPVPVTSIEWQAGKFTVYNLAVERYHTYFANGIWVHNQKGGSQPRSIFKDTAYWNPAVMTNAAGRAQVRFTLPDNLTTWVVSGIGATADTIVGQTSNEIIVTKSVIIRPILPNLVLVGDELTISALVHNFTDSEHTFTANLRSTAGGVQSPRIEPFVLPASGMRQLSWHVQPQTRAEPAEFTFSVRSITDRAISDIVVARLPVRTFGFWDRHAETANEATSFSLKLAPDRDPVQTSVELSFAPTLVGTLPAAMRYLVDYPYGCVEQTTSRFVPAVIAKANTALFSDALKGKDIDAIITAGIAKLQELQQDQGGWAWWHEGSSDTFITTYVIEYLLQAKALGYDVPADSLARAQAYLETNTLQSGQALMSTARLTTDTINRTYALALLGADKGKLPLTEFDGLSPDTIAMAVLANSRNGFTKAAEAGLKVLRAQAQIKGDGVYWVAGSREQFGSIDGSTAFVIRALLTSTKDQDRALAAQAVRYLARNRRAEYWSNTFSTAQLIRAVVDLARRDQETNPFYAYQVLLDGTEITHGQVTTAHDSINVVVPIDRIKEDGSTLVLGQSGIGAMYSTLLVNQYRTDPTQALASRGLDIRRELTNVRGSHEPIRVGDLVNVKLTVSGLTSSMNYGVINDQLPAGLIPINRTFKNEQGSGGQSGQPYYYDYYGQEVTENGMILSLYYMGPDTHTYSYQARAVSEGVFKVPPAEVSLMYTPETYGRSEASSVVVLEAAPLAPGLTELSRVTPELQAEPAPATASRAQLPLPLIVVIGLIVLVFMVALIWAALHWSKRGPPSSPIPPAGTSQPQ